MIPQKLEPIRKPDSGESQKEVIASHNIGSSTMCGIKKQKDQL